MGTLLENGRFAINLTDATYSNGNLYHYAYDAAGNRLLKQKPGETVVYTYDEANQLTHVGGTPTTLDGNGNLLNDGSRSYAYDDLDRLIQVTQGITTTQYGYTGDGDRLWQQTDGVTTTFTLDLNGALAQVLAQSQGSGLTTVNFLPGIGQQQSGGIWTYFHSDALGSVRDLSGVTGNAIGHVDYSPFGEIVNSTGMASWFGFTGEQQDGASGLTYLRARYYDPALGRFLTPDSLIPDLTNGQALNAYAYVYNDPVNLIDPSGNIPDVGNAVVNIAKHLPASWQSSIKGYAASGLVGLNKWYSQPDDCDCSPGTGAPQSIVNFSTGLNNKVANPAAQLSFAAYTNPAQNIASRVDVYSRWPASTRFGPVGVDKLYKTYNNVDVTNLKLLDYGSEYKYTNGTGQMSKVLRMSDGRKVVIHNAETRVKWSGAKGVGGSILGSGIIDGAFQLYDDWAAGLCLSNNQKFWRAVAAGLIGLGSGLIATVAVVGAVAFGAPVVAAALVGFGVGIGIDMY